MKNDDVDASISRAEDNWTNAVQGHPQKCEIGFFSYSDAPGGIGGGMGSFVWFKTRDQMLDFIEQTLPYSPPGRSDKDWTEVATQTSAIVSEMRSNEIDDKSGIDRLNAVLKTFSRIEWMGTFEELMTSSDRYPAEVRAAFHGDECESEDLSIIGAHDVEDFKNFLGEWGI